MQTNALIYDILSALLAISFHGMGHLLAARTLGLRPRAIRPSSTGLRMLLDVGAFPSYGAEAWVALGGPLGNLLGNVPLLLLSLAFPALLPPALCRRVVTLSLFLAIWNLLPIHGFDGGRVLGCLLLHAPRMANTPDTVDRLLSLCSAVCFFLLWLLSVYLLLRTGRAFSLFAFCIQLFWGTVRRP